MSKRSALSLLKNMSEVKYFVVTGRLYMKTTRFAHTYSPNEEGFKTAMSINLWNGSVWVVDKLDIRHLLKRVTN